MFTIRIRIFSSSFEFSNSPFLLCNTLGGLPRNALSKELRHFMVFVDRAHSSSSCKGLSQLQELTGYLAGGSWVKRTKSYSKQTRPNFSLRRCYSLACPVSCESYGKISFHVKNYGTISWRVKNYRTIPSRVKKLQDNLMSCLKLHTGQSLMSC